MFCIGNVLLQIFAHEGFVKACPVGLTSDSYKTVWCPGVTESFAFSVYIHSVIYMREREREREREGERGRERERERERELTSLSLAGNSRVCIES